MRDKKPPPPAELLCWRPITQRGEGVCWDVGMKGIINLGYQDRSMIRQVAQMGNVANVTNNSVYEIYSVH